MNDYKSKILIRQRDTHPIKFQPCATSFKTLSNLEMQLKFITLWHKFNPQGKFIFTLKGNWAIVLRKEIHKLFKCHNNITHLEGSSFFNQSCNPERGFELLCHAIIHNWKFSIWRHLYMWKKQLDPCKMRYKIEQILESKLHTYWPGLKFCLNQRYQGVQIRENCSHQVVQHQNPNYYILHTRKRRASAYSVKAEHHKIYIPINKKKIINTISWTSTSSNRHILI